MAFFNSDPELKKLLNSAVSGNWTPQQFVAKLQNTRWFKTKGEAARQIYALQTADPATFKQRLTTASTQVGRIAAQMGAALPYGTNTEISKHALALGWSEDQIRGALTQYIKGDKSGLYRGGAGAAQMQIREVASDYGYSLSPAQSGNWIKGMVNGSVTIEQVKQQMMAYAASKYPGLADRINAGETLEQIAAPYKDSYSKVLEVPATAVNLRDPAIQKALQAKDAKGKPTTQSVWQFEQDLKSDPRWLQTNNARDQLVGNTRKVLQDFGLVN
jgi:hypothetical protein